MIARVQPRHTKIWLAGKEKNWPLAAYELDELKEALADVARYQPHWNDLPIADMMNSVMADRTKALNDAIDAGDEARFVAAYGKVTAGCNSCHRAADRCYLVIQVP
jgi:transposase